MNPWDGIEQRVIDAYHRRGLEPAKFSFSGERCCALGALYNDRFDHIGLELAADLGVSYTEATMFTYGFDAGLGARENHPYTGSAAFDAGVRTGIRVREELL